MGEVRALETTRFSIASHRGCCSECSFCSIPVYHKKGKRVRVHVASGIRHDLILFDKKAGMSYLKEMFEGHIPGQLKIAPEHSDDEVLKLMGKPDGRASWVRRIVNAIP